MRTIQETLDACQKGEPITWQEYVHAASRTCSTKFYAGSDQYHRSNAIYILEEFIKIGNMVDEMKKAIFYGKNIEEVIKKHERYSDFYCSPDADTEDWPADLSPDLVHWILGDITEGVELAEALKDVLTGKKSNLDMVNLIEEEGDGEWYRHLPYLAAEKEGLPIDERLQMVWRRNLLKLAARFPEKFTEEHAVNRDLKAEREILES